MIYTTELNVNERTSSCLVLTIALIQVRWGSGWLQKKLLHRLVHLHWLLVVYSVAGVLDHDQLRLVIQMPAQESQEHISQETKINGAAND